MVMDFSYNDVLEHIDLNNMLLAMKDWGVITGLLASERGAGANMSVDVAAGACWIDENREYEPITTNVVISAADATNARKDIIIYDASGNIPAVVTGTPSATPQPPDIPAGDILLALVDVSANASVINDADIADKRIIVYPTGYYHGWFHAYNKVYDAAAPTSWTDLDLSSTVGSNYALVLLRVENMDTTFPLDLSFRPNGIAKDYNTIIQGNPTMSSFTLNDVSGTTALTIVKTDASGVIEWDADGAHDCEIYVLGYSRLATAY